MARLWIFLFLVLALVAVPNTRAQTTEFVYQGQLQNSAAPASGNFDFEFLLFDQLTAGTQQGATLTRSGVAVTNGTFSVKLDFGASFPGASRFLEIHVKPTGGGAFTPLTPRQAVSSTPYAVKSLNADTATHATTATTATNATQLGGVAAGQYVVTTDPRMTDSRTPTAGSPNYIQNGTSPQASSNFNISGTGNANIFNAATQFNIGGNRAFTTAGGSNNTIAGTNAGSVNTGDNDSFFGGAAGNFNTSGTQNSFFGMTAGFSNTTGNNNSFFGVHAGFGNTTGGNNTIIGNLSDVGGGSLNFATAIGAGAIVNASNTVVLGRAADSVQVPGNLNVTGTFTGSGSGLTSLNASNISTGTLADARLSANVALLTGTQTFSGAKTFSAASVFNSTVGIGTASPQRALSIVGGLVVDQANQNTTSNGFGITFGSFSGEGIASNRGAGANPNGLDFFAGGGVTPRMSLTNSGNFGIGTTNPAYPFNVRGSAGAGGGQGVAEFVSNSNDTGLRIGNTALNGRTWTLFSSGGTSGLCQGCFNIYDATAGQSRLDIDTNGNVGIGTTSPTTRLDVRGNISASGSIAANNLPGLEFDVPTDPFDDGVVFFVDANQTATIKTITVDVPANGFLFFSGSVFGESRIISGPSHIPVGTLSLFDETSNTTIATAKFAGTITTQTIQGVLPVSAGSRTLSLKVGAGGTGEQVLYWSNTGRLIVMFFPVRY